MMEEVIGRKLTFDKKWLDLNEAQNYISVAGGIELRDKIEIKYLQRNKMR